MPASDPSLAAPTDVGSLGIYQLKRLWSRAMAGAPPAALPSPSLTA